MDLTRFFLAGLAGMNLAMFIVWSDLPDGIRILNLVAVALCSFAAWYNPK